MVNLRDHREAIWAAAWQSERHLLDVLCERWAPNHNDREWISQQAGEWVEALRNDSASGLMEAFLAEYGLSTEEGVALMCLAEALLRVPDAETIDELIEDKIAPSKWGEHLGKSSSSLVNASTWALLLTGGVLNEEKSTGIASILHRAVKRLGEPLIRIAVGQAMKELGRQFVLGETIEDAVARAGRQETQGYTYSYDMLGEAAMTSHDADTYFQSYKDAIATLARHGTDKDVRLKPGISIKLSALHPRYDALKHERVIKELLPRALDLVQDAKKAGIGLNIDAEEASRLDISLDIVQGILSHERGSDWDGFGVVVQAYGKKASSVIDWLYAVSKEFDQKIMVRLVKGAYWDTEVKRAQIDGIDTYPVFTRKTYTDISYICCARKLLSMTDRIYAQFATHNAHTMAAIVNAAKPGLAYEFQRLHGMGEALHDIVKRETDRPCRIYAPVGAHRDLLAYLVRRLLENGANSSFVNQIVDTSVPVDEIVADPFEILSTSDLSNVNDLPAPPDLFAPHRVNAKGWDLRNPNSRLEFDAARTPFQESVWSVMPLLAGSCDHQGESVDVINPADPGERVGRYNQSTIENCNTALTQATVWTADPEVRASILRRSADLFERDSGEIFAILIREAGKSSDDAISEIREAVDFLRFYAGEAERHGARPARGVIACISPWNFPLAIFTGQIAAALAAGNAVLAKPAEQTPIAAWKATTLLHEAGVPLSALQLLFGEGVNIGKAITQDPRVDGVVFTGSTETGQRINRAMAEGLKPDAPLIAETGGLNAMIVDSTALPEQAVRDVIASAFQSAGQRCSALRVLYLQEDIYAPFCEMLFGAMDELAIGNPWSFSTDIGPVIDGQAKDKIRSYLDGQNQRGKLVKTIKVPSNGYFVAPSVIKVCGIEDLKEEIFGPVLHLASFAADNLESVIRNINARGYGLTFGIHSRIDDRVDQVTKKIRAGNIYVNRNQIGAVVESQPFGGEGLSGTGPKAGGPNYVSRFYRSKVAGQTNSDRQPFDARYGISLQDIQATLQKRQNLDERPISTQTMPGPTGESNRLSIHPRGVMLCLGPSCDEADEQALAVQKLGCPTLRIAPGVVGADAIDGALNINYLKNLNGFAGVVLYGDEESLRAARIALADRQGPILPLITNADFKERCVTERHICIDTTAAGGNATLLANAF